MTFKETDLRKIKDPDEQIGKRSGKNLNG